jgi:hypothetical protein
MTPVQDSLGTQLVGWTYRSPRTRWRAPIWVVFCLLVCSSFILAAVGVSSQYTTLWILAAVASLFLYTAAAVHVLFLTRHREYAIHERGVRVRYFWNDSDVGRSRSLWWDELEGFSLRGGEVVLMRKEEAPIVLHGAPTAEEVERVLGQKIPHRAPAA